jgi:hypothetical protein
MLRIHEGFGIAFRKPLDSLGITSDTFSQCKVSKKGRDCYVVSLHEVRRDGTGSGDPLTFDVGMFLF